MRKLSSFILFYLFFNNLIFGWKIIFRHFFNSFKIYEPYLLNVADLFYYKNCDMHLRWKHKNQKSKYFNDFVLLYKKENQICKLHILVELKGSKSWTREWNIFISKQFLFIIRSYKYFLDIKIDIRQHIWFYINIYF